MAPPHELTVSLHKIEVVKVHFHSKVNSQVVSVVQATCFGRARVPERPKHDTTSEFRICHKTREMVRISWTDGVVNGKDKIIRIAEDGLYRVAKVGNDACSNDDVKH
jgi:hypothetical protein